MNTPVDSVTLAELEREFTPAQILGMFAASPDDPKWPLLLAWLAYGKAARLEARVARGSPRGTMNVMNTTTPVSSIHAFDLALAQFRSTPAAQTGGRIRWTGTPEQVQALQSELMNTPGGAIATATATATDGGPVFRGQWMNVDLYAHPNGGGFSIDEAAPPALTHPVAPVLIQPDVSSEIREHVAGLRELRNAVSELSAALPPANDVDAQARATIVHLLAEAREPYGPGEKATLVGAAAQLLAVVK